METKEILIMRDSVALEKTTGYLVKYGFYSQAIHNRRKTGMSQELNKWLKLDDETILGCPVILQ